MIYSREFVVLCYGGKMKIIDMHAHVFPEKIAMRAVSNVGTYYGIEMSGNGTLDGLFQSAGDLDASFVISNAALKPENVRHGNEFLFDCVKKFPQKLIALGSVHPDMDINSVCKEMEFIKENDGRGIKLHPDFQHFKIEDKKLFPVYEAAQSMNLPILMHMGDENTDNSTPKGLRFIADKYPDLEIIAAHMGGWMAWEESDEYLVGSRVYMDTSDALFVLPSERVFEMIEKHGSEKIMFGSDFPFRLTGVAYNEMEALPLTNEQKENIYHKTAEKLFKIK
jgi:predicted TIM-barrel fold metal-dependent hydrolase